MIKKIVLSVFLILSLGCSLNTQLSKEEIGAIKNEPNDVPYAGQTSDGFFLLGETSPPFDLDPNDPTIQSFYPISTTNGRPASSLFYFKLMNSETMQYLAYWVPQTGDEGEYDIVFKATDSHGATTEQVVHFTVLPVLNEPPMVLVRNF